MTIQTNQTAVPDAVSFSHVRHFSFHQLSLQARRLEQAQQYQPAGDAWEAASEMACNAHNRNWALARALFCQAMSQKNCEPVVGCRITCQTMVGTKSG
ncbi:ANR family transcriptional regulator [Escherichia coli]|uniref:ANR family transcriptional regulator n=1 Tax=Escherichia coli TaxID=562 RepID=UPI001CDB23A5|nr:ANR family transcriptional regulator [Escherichia coli]